MSALALALLRAGIAALVTGLRHLTAPPLTWVDDGQCSCEGCLSVRFPGDAGPPTEPLPPQLRAYEEEVSSHG